MQNAGKQKAMNEAHPFRSVSGLDALALVEEAHGACFATDTLAVSHKLLELCGGLHLEEHLVA